jgi:hypothetical protein
MTAHGNKEPITKIINAKKGWQSDSSGKGPV